VLPQVKISVSFTAKLAPLNWPAIRYRACILLYHLCNCLHVATYLKNRLPVLHMYHLQKEDFTMSVAAHSKVFLLADDTKCFKHNIKIPSDTQLLQQDLTYLSHWSKESLLTFHSSKSTHLSFKSKITTSYNINDSSKKNLTLT